MGNLTHFDAGGNAVMVDLAGKQASSRTARACGSIYVNAAILAAVQSGSAAKGDVLGVARVAGIMAVKNTPQIIPLAHPLLINRCAIDFTLYGGNAQNTEPHNGQRIEALCTVSADGVTGVEMEALTGVTAALLTVYDMCKALGKDMLLSGIRLLEKTGGKSGNYSAADMPQPPPSDRPIQTERPAVQNRVRIPGNRQ